jgi:hypothetical protein
MITVRTVYGLNLPFCNLFPRPKNGFNIYRIITKPPEKTILKVPLARPLHFSDMVDKRAGTEVSTHLYLSFDFFYVSREELSVFNDAKSKLKMKQEF